MLGRHRRDVGVMMLHAHERDAIVLGHTLGEPSRRVVRMEIASHQIWLCPKKAQQVVDIALEDRERPGLA